MLRDSDPAFDASDPSQHLTHVYVERSCLDHRYTREILNRSNLPYRVVDSTDNLRLSKADYADYLTAGKKGLLLCCNRGDFIKQCPETKVYNCCHYQIINTGTGCPMDCSYCILQAYLNNPYLRFFVNVELLFQQLETVLQGPSLPFVRFGTGEFTDSLALDRLTQLSPRLVHFFAGQRRAVLELKTKSASIENLEGLSHCGRTIVAWSLNSEEVIRTEERRTASLQQRLEAASRCISWGYDVAFHFDPIISYPGWEEGYSRAIDALFEQIPVRAIRWISLGAFRYVPALKRIGVSRFTGTPIYYHEFIEGLDQKQRYFRAQRVHLYRTLYNRLRASCLPRTCIYFCMESDEIWNEVMGYIPSERGGLQTMLDEAVNW